MPLSIRFPLLLTSAAFLIAAFSPAGAAETDGVELSNLAACYADGIDMIGAGKTDAGASRWRQCFAEDVKFTLSFGTSFTMTCPGEKCPMPASMSGVERRVAAARNTYDRAGYVATSHHLTSIGIEQNGPDRARVSAHLQAWHMRKDGATVLGLGTWSVDARKTSAGWRIVDARKPLARRHAEVGLNSLTGRNRCVRWQCLLVSSL